MTTSNSLWSEGIHGELSLIGKASFGIDLFGADGILVLTVDLIIYKFSQDLDRLVMRNKLLDLDQILPTKNTKCMKK